jgi:hypothetical protein
MVLCVRLAPDFCASASLVRHSDSPTWRRELPDLKWAAKGAKESDCRRRVTDADKMGWWILWEGKPIRSPRVN